MNITPPLSSSRPESLLTLLESVVDRKGADTIFHYLHTGDAAGSHTALGADALYTRSREIGGTLQDLLRCRSRAEPARVVILCASSLEFVKALFGCILAGVISIPAYPPVIRGPRGLLQTLREIVEDARPDCMLVDEAVASVLDRTSADEFSVRAPMILRLDTLEDASCWIAPSVTMHDPVLIQYTSGSTTRPRGVVLSHKNIMENLSSLTAAINPPPGSIGVSWLPPSHDMGLIGNIMFTLYSNLEKLVLMSPQSFMERPVRWLRAISHFSAWATSGPNFAYDLCTRTIRTPALEGVDLKSLSLAFCGAEPIDPRTLAAFVDRFGSFGFRRTAFRPCYGLAEATLYVSSSLPGEMAILRVSGPSLARGQIHPPKSNETIRELVSCGSPQPNVELIVVDPETRCRVTDGHVGELWIRGPSVADRYWREDCTGSENSFAATLADDPTRHFFRTGDSGALYGGQVYITGRLKDVLIVRGKNYDAHDLESAVAGIDDSLRLGRAIAFSDMSCGREQIILVIEARHPPAGMDYNVFAKKIRQAVSRRMGLQVDVIDFVAPRSLPITSSGKLRRSECRQLWSAGAFKQAYRSRFENIESVSGIGVFSGIGVSSNHSSLRRLIETEVRTCAQIPKDEVISNEATLREIGLDSLGVAQLSTTLSVALGRDLPMELFDDDATISGLVNRLANSGIVQRINDFSRSETFVAPLPGFDAPSTTPISNQRPSALTASTAAPAQDPDSPRDLDFDMRHRLMNLSFHDVFEPAKRFRLSTALKRSGMLPFYLEFSDWTGTHATIDGRRVLILSSLDYLGLACDPRVTSAMAKACLVSGSGRNSSRVHSGTTPEHREMELKLAQFLGREECLICTTGYQAMASLVTALMNPTTTLVVDESAHASILDGAAIAKCRLLRFRHNSSSELRRLMESAKSVLVMVEGLYSNDGDVSPLPAIRAVCDEFQARLAVDDAHGLGVLGSNGRGIEEHYGCIGAADVLAGSFSKSLASVGGWIAGDKELIEWVRYHGRTVIFTAAIAPAALAAANAALDILIAEPDLASRVSNNANFLRGRLRSAGVPFSGELGPVIRIPMGDDFSCVSAAMAMLKQGVYVHTVLHPAVPRDGAMLRLCVSAIHQRKDIQWAAEVVGECYTRCQKANAGRLDS